MCAVNLGDGSDSVAAMVGAISGAIHGLDEGLIDQYKTYITRWDQYTIAATINKKQGYQKTCNSGLVKRKLNTGLR